MWIQTGLFVFIGTLTMCNATEEYGLKTELLKETKSELITQIYALTTTLVKIKFGKEDDEFLYGDYVSSINSENSKPNYFLDWHEPGWYNC